MLEPMQNTKVTIESPDSEGFMKKMVLEISNEMTCDEWIPTFRLILQFMTYGQQSIDETIPEEEE